MFSLAIVGYLFLGGIGGGLCFVGGLSGFLLLSPKHREVSFLEINRFFGTLFATAAIALVLGALLLLADSDNYPALPALFFSARPTWLNFGSWFISAGIILSGSLLISWFAATVQISRVISRILHFISAILGLAIAAYTGLFLSSMKSVPLWHTPLVPVLFLLSSISCGLVILNSTAKGMGVAGHMKELVHGCLWADVIVVVLELICAAAFVVLALWAPREGSLAVEQLSALGLVSGRDAWLWWGGFIGVGLVVLLGFDIALLFRGHIGDDSFWSLFMPAFCVVVGALTMRYCIVQAGVHPILGF